MEYEAKNVDWSASAGQQLDALARALPPHPKLDIGAFIAILSKVQTLDEMDVDALKNLIAQTGHSTEEEFTRHLRKAVDLYRPKFDEETRRGDMFANTRELWKILWNKEVNVRAAIIRPALARAVHDPEPPDPNLKTRLANLRLPDKNG